MLLELVLVVQLVHQARGRVRVRTLPLLVASLARIHLRVGVE